MERNRATQLGVTIRSESIEMLIYSPAKLMKDPFIGYKMQELPFCLGEISSWSTSTPTSGTCSGKLGASHHCRPVRNWLWAQGRGKEGKQFRVVLGWEELQEPWSGHGTEPKIQNAGKLSGACITVAPVQSCTNQMCCWAHSGNIMGYFRLLAF